MKVQSSKKRTQKRKQSVQQSSRSSLDVQVINRSPGRFQLNINFQLPAIFSYFFVFSWNKEAVKGNDHHEMEIAFPYLLCCKQSVRQFVCLNEWRTDYWVIFVLAAHMIYSRPNIRNFILIPCKQTTQHNGWAQLGVFSRGISATRASLE